MFLTHPSSALIAGRIWFSTRKVSNFTNQPTLMPIVVILIESGSMYAASCIILVVVYLLGSNAQYPVVDGTFPIISIAFNLIIVRIALGIAHGGPSIKTTQNPTSVQTGSFGHRTTQGAGYPMKPLAVTVTHLVHQNTDADDTHPVKESEETYSANTDERKESWNPV